MRCFVAASAMCLFCWCVLGQTDTNAPPRTGEPDDQAVDVRRLSLRRSVALLPAGEWEWETGIRMLRDTSDPAAVLPGSARRIDLPLALRAGVLRWLELSAEVAMVSAEREWTQVEPDGTVLPGSDTESGLGDTRFGANVLLCAERAAWPEAVLSLSASAPTGSDPYADQLSAATGSGFWVWQGGVSFVRTSDPLVLFWGLSAAFYDSAASPEGDIQPAPSFGYNFGLGFGINRDVSLTLAFEGAVQEELELAGVAQPFTGTEPVSLLLGCTTRCARHLFLETSLRMGVTDDAPDARAGLALIGRIR